MVLHEETREIFCDGFSPAPFSAPAAKAFVNFHKNQALPAIIEYIRDGGYYRAYFPQQKVNAGVSLSGVQVDAFKRIEGYSQPQAEPFAVEAKFFTEARLLNRDVKVRVEDADDYGNIYGSVIHPNGNVAVLLLRNGFAKIQDWSIRLIEDPLQYREAQKEAQQKRIRKWRVGRQNVVFCDLATGFFVPLIFHTH